jgi:hypothetical protein
MGTPKHVKGFGKGISIGSSMESLEWGPNTQEFERQVKGSLYVL